MKKFFESLSDISLYSISMSLVCILLAIAAFGTKSNEAGVNLGQGWYYPLTTRVVEVDENADLVTCEDFNGNLWEFEGCEDWQKGDICSLLMDSNGTKKIFDDKIMLAQYGGPFEGWN